MRHYEVVAVIHPDQQGRVGAMIELYKKIVTDGGGVLHRLEDWGRRPLAYPIQNQHKAHYVLMNIECGNDALEKLRETFRFSDSIIRSLIVRREEAITAPSIMMKADKKPSEEKDGDDAGASDDSVSEKKDGKDSENGADSVAAKDSSDDVSQSAAAAAAVSDVAADSSADDANAESGAESETESDQEKDK